MCRRLRRWFGVPWLERGTRGDPHVSELFLVVQTTLIHWQSVSFIVSTALLEALVSALDRDGDPRALRDWASNFRLVALV